MCSLKQKTHVNIQCLKHYIIKQLLSTFKLTCELFKFSTFVTKSNNLCPLIINNVH